MLGTWVSPAKTAEQIEMPSTGAGKSCGSKELRTRGVHSGQIGQNDLCGGGDVGCHYHYCGDLFITLVSKVDPHLPGLNMKISSPFGSPTDSAMQWNTDNGTTISFEQLLL